MIKLENLQNETLSKGIKSLSPMNYESIQIKNRLLDGSYHIQTIGDPIPYFTFEILSDHNQVDKINIAEHKGEKLKLIIDNKYYIGLLEERLEWSRFTMRYKKASDTLYTSTARINIQEEESV